MLKYSRIVSENSTEVQQNIFRKHCWRTVDSFPKTVLKYNDYFPKTVLKYDYFPKTVLNPND